jgi:hypothetical protein
MQRYLQVFHLDSFFLLLFYVDQSSDMILSIHASEMKGCMLFVCAQRCEA